MWLRYDSHMTYQESYALIKELMAVKTKDELQDKMGEHMGRVDGTFFTVVGEITARLRTQGKVDAADHLNQIGDALARLRFMI